MVEGGRQPRNRPPTLSTTPMDFYHKQKSIVYSYRDACLCVNWCWPGHDDVIKWKHFPRYWHFVRGIHWSPVDSPHKGQWREALMFSLIWTNSLTNTQTGGDLRRHHSYYDVTAMNRIKWCTFAGMHASKHIDDLCFWRSIAVNSLGDNHD